MKIEDSGLHLYHVLLHVIKKGSVESIIIDEQSALCKSLHDLIIRIGHNVDGNIFHLLEEHKYPFWYII
jgi:hypothetical protein